MFNLDIDALNASIAKDKANRETLRAACAAMDGFCPFDLGHWMELAARAGVPMIPATAVATGATALWNDEAHGHPAIDVMIAQARQAVDAESRPMILRWSWASHGDVKHHTNGGTRDWHPDLVEPYINDERSYELQMDFPLPEFSIWMRPWMTLTTRTAPKPAMDPQHAAHHRERENGYRSEQGRALVTGPLPTHDQFALEARVYVESNAIKGISAYFPQCPMDPADLDVQTLFRQARVMAQALIDHQTKPVILPRVHHVHGTNDNAWTVDFVMTADGNVMLLEGGPPHMPGGGAHPCCFAPGRIAGEAFASAKENLR
jgi:hypothetical protein